MKAALVKETGKTPVYGDFKEPIPADGEVQIAVTAAALSPTVKSRAAGKHYSATGNIPFVAGVDGVGRLKDGRRVYFAFAEAPFGSMAERAVVKRSHCVPLPDSLDDVTAAALAIPGVSSWAALKMRAKLVAGETVLVNGATGTAGRLAVQIAKHLGAKKVIATGRNVETLQRLTALGADVVIHITQPAETLEAEFQEQFRGDGVDVVLDYLWGPSAELLIIAAAKAAKEAVPIRYIEIGAVSGANISLPSAALRACALQLMGAATGSIPLELLIAAVGELMMASVPDHLKIETQAIPLADVEEAWTKDSGNRRTVFIVA
jgi:NADPH:quinone reductase-like Zn-dependent oxidoreductase